MGVQMQPSRPTARRLGAAFIDLVLFWGAFWVVFRLVADGVPSGTDPSGAYLNLELGDTNYVLTGASAVLYTAVWIVAAFLYFGVLAGLTGWTLGKLVTGVRVVGRDGAPIGPVRGMIRPLAWVADGFPYFIPGLVGFVMVLASGGRRVADRWADTYVVRSSAVGQAIAGSGHGS